MPKDHYHQFIADGFERVERDDRLLDVFPNQTREKGIELWYKWTDDTVEIVRIHLTKGAQSMSRHTYSHAEIEQALVHNRQLQL